MATEYYLINESTLRDIGDAIKEVTGSTDTIYLNDIPGMIDTLEVVDMTSVEQLIEGTLEEISDDYLEHLSNGALSYCSGLKTVSFPKVISIGDSAFKLCTNLSTVDLPVVTEIGKNAFQGCTSLTSVNFPLLEDIDDYAFSTCSSLESVNFPLVKSANGWNVFSGCSSLRNVVFPELTSLGYYAFKNCTALESIDLHSIQTIKDETFAGCTSLNAVFLRSEEVCSLLNADAFYNTPIASGEGRIFVPVNLFFNYKDASEWSTYADKIVPIDTTICVETINNKTSLMNTTRSISTRYYYNNTNPTILVSSSDTSVATISNVVYADGVLTFDINTLSTESSVVVTIIISDENNTYSSTFNVDIRESLPANTYLVEAIESANYGFVLNDNGYYESTNAGQKNSASICKVNIFSNGMHNMYLDCINSGESNYDFGILSTVDNTLGLTYTVDSTNLFKSFRGLSSTEVQTVNYGVLEYGNHFIYVKYRKDGSGNSGNDSLQFKVRFE